MTIVEHAASCALLELDGTTSQRLLRLSSHLLGHALLVRLSNALDVRVFGRIYKRLDARTWVKPRFWGSRQFGVCCDIDGNCPTDCSPVGRIDIRHGVLKCRQIEKIQSAKSGRLGYLQHLKMDRGVRIRRLGLLDSADDVLNLRDDSRIGDQGCLERRVRLPRFDDRLSDGTGVSGIRDSGRLRNSVSASITSASKLAAAAARLTAWTIRASGAGKSDSTACWIRSSDVGWGGI